MKELRIELLDSDGFRGVIKAKKISPPEGMTITEEIGFSADLEAGDLPQIIVVQFVLPIALGIAANYLTEYLKQRGTKRIRIEHEETFTADRDSVQHVIRTKLEIDQ